MSGRKDNLHIVSSIKTEAREILSLPSKCEEMRRNDHYPHLGY